MPALVQADFLELLQRTTSAEWLDGLLDTTTGQAVLNALFDMGAEAAADTIAGCESAIISLAAGGRPGVAYITLTRSVFATAVTIPAGYPFLSSKGTELRVTASITVPAGTATFVLPIQTLAFAETVNTFAQDAFVAGITGSAASTAGAPIITDGAANVVLGPPGTTVNTVVASSTDITQSTYDWLSVLGNERGVQRQAGELEEDYRLRVRNIPDTVSPKAISTSVNGAGIRVGIAPIMVLEPFRDGADAATQAAYNLGYFDPVFASGITPAADSPGEDFLDDRTRMLVDRRMATAYFELDTPSAIRMPDDQVLFCDSGYLDDFVFGYTDLGQHPAVISALMSIWEEANRKRAAAVQFDLVLPVAQTLAQVGTTSSAGLTLLLTFAPTVGTVWMLVDAEASQVYDVSTLAPLVTGWNAPFFHTIRFTFEDTSTFFTPSSDSRETDYWSLWRLAEAGMPISKRITQIDLFVSSDGVLPVNFYCQARVLTVTT
jgi:hypothetical protein